MVSEPRMRWRYVPRSRPAAYFIMAAWLVGVVGFAAAITGLLAGCGSSGSSSPASAGSAASTGSSASPGSASAGSAAGGAVSVPLQVVRAASGRVVLLADISVGGGPVTKVVLDTGSAGLIIERSAVGSGARPTGRSTTVTYVGFSVKAQINTATVSLRGAIQAVRTAPVKVGVTDQAVPFPASVGATGILGIAPAGNGPGSLPLLSPLVQLTAPLSGGFTISADTSSAALRLGPPAAGSGSVRIALTKAGFSYPDGQPAYEKSLPLCWTIGSARGCARTSMDTGDFYGIVSSGSIPGARPPDGQITKGTAITISDSRGTALCSFSAGSSPAEPAPEFMTFPVMNTGIRLFFANSVGYDLDTGTVIITPNPAGHC